MTPEAVQAILPWLSLLAVSVGVFVALLQFGHANRLRELDVVMRLFGRFSSKDFQQDYWRVMNWRYPTFEAFESKASEEDFASWFVVTAFFEELGLIYRRRFASLSLLDDLMSGPIIDSWLRTRHLTEGYRTKYRRPQMGEWRQYLADKMMARLDRLEGRKGKSRYESETGSSVPRIAGRRAAAGVGRSRQKARKRGRRTR